MLLNDKKREEILEQRKDEFVADMDDDEFDEILTNFSKSAKNVNADAKVIWKCRK